jgi:hypothetical protein
MNSTLRPSAHPPTSSYFPPTTNLQELSGLLGRALRAWANTPERRQVLINCHIIRPVKPKTNTLHVLETLLECILFDAQHTSRFDVLIYILAESILKMRLESKNQDAAHQRKIDEWTYVFDNIMVNRATLYTLLPRYLVVHNVRHRLWSELRSVIREVMQITPT